MHFAFTDSSAALLKDALPSTDLRFCLFLWLRFADDALLQRGRCKKALAYIES